MDPASDPHRRAQKLFRGLPRRYDLLAEVLSFGQNGRWRRAMVDQVVSHAPAHVLDVATGTAGVAIELSGRGPTRVTGVDLTESMLTRGCQNVSRCGLERRIRLVAGAAERLPFPDATFDGLTFTYLFRYVDDPQATLSELVRVVEPGSPVASLEFFVPPNRFWRAWWWLYTRFVLPAAGGLTGGRAWFGVGRFLGPSISGFYRRYPLPRLVALWRDAGLVDVGVRIMSLGGGVVMWGRKATADG